MTRYYLLIFSCPVFLEKHLQKSTPYNKYYITPEINLHKIISLDQFTLLLYNMGLGDCNGRWY